MPKRGELVKPLRPEDVEIREDGVPQKTKLFKVGRSYQSGIPVEISLLFDCSGSVVSPGTLDPYVFHESILDEYENVSIAVYAFSDDRTWRRHPDGGGLLVRHLRHAGGGRLIGLRFCGRCGAQAGHRHLPRADSQLLLRWCVARVHVSENIPSIGDYERLAEQTGGRSFAGVQSDMTLQLILRMLAKEVLAYTHIAGYYPNASEKPKSHDAEVVLLNPSAGQLNGGRRTVVH